jgi:hypothetical protein
VWAPLGDSAPMKAVQFAHDLDRTVDGLKIAP